MLEFISANEKNLKDKGLEFFQNMKTIDGVEVKTVHCNNAGENKELEKGNAHQWVQHTF